MRPHVFSFDTGKCRFCGIDMNAFQGQPNEELEGCRPQPDPHEEFLSKICDAPEDSLAKQVYADYLEEHGDPMATGWRIIAAGKYMPWEEKSQAMRGRWTWFRLTGPDLVPPPWAIPSRAYHYFLTDNTNIPTPILMRPLRRDSMHSVNNLSAASLRDAFVWLAWAFTQDAKAQQELVDSKVATA